MAQSLKEKIVTVEKRINDLWCKQAQAERRLLRVEDRPLYLLLGEEETPLPACEKERAILIIQLPQGLLRRTTSLDRLLVRVAG